MYVSEDEPGTPVISIDNFLLPDDHPLVAAELSRLGQAKMEAVVKRRKTKPECKWVQQALSSATSSSVLGRQWGYNKWEDTALSVVSS